MTARGKQIAALTQLQKPPGNPRYVKGARFERAVMVRLNLLGWTTWRSAGSHSPADVVALRCVEARAGFAVGTNEDAPTIGIVSRRTEALLVQAKSGNARLSAQDRATFLAYTRACGATAVEAFQVQGIGVRLVDLETGKELG